MQYRTATVRDIPYMVALHQEYISWGFLTSLGDRFLKYLYESLISFPEAGTFVAFNGDRVVGFTCGVLSIREFYSFFLKRYTLRVIPALIWRMLHPSNLRRSIETLIYPSRHSLSGLPEAELLVIIIEARYQGRGIAAVLFKELSAWFRGRHIERFKTTVGEGNLRGIRCFKKMGCIDVGRTEVHRGEPSRIFICRCG